MTARVSRFEDQDAFVAAALAALNQSAQAAVAARGRFVLALSGGATPLPLYAAMAQKGLGAPWEAVHFFFGDERLVPVGDRRSNFGAVAPVLFTRAPIPVGNIHPMPVEIRPAARAALVYEAEVREAFGAGPKDVPRFDLILLGMGPDGHTASLFPGSPLLAETERLVAAAPPPETAEPKVARLTFTLPLLDAAREVVFLASERGKEKALAQALGGDPDPAFPASLVRPEHGAVWLLLA